MATISHHLKSESPSWPVFAAVGAGLSAMLTALGTFWDLTGNDSGGNTVSDYLPVLGMIAVGTIVVFAIATRYPTATVGLGLAVLAVASNVAFWSGLPVVLAAGALSIAWPQRSERASMVTISLAVLAIAVQVFGNIAG